MLKVVIFKLNNVDTLIQDVNQIARTFYADDIDVQIQGSDFIVTAKYQEKPNVRYPESPFPEYGLQKSNLNYLNPTQKMKFDFNNVDEPTHLAAKNFSLNK